MIRYFSRQIVNCRYGNRGQASALFLVVAVTLVAVVFASVRLHQVAVGRVTSSNAVDAIALSAATWEARSLNLIAALNDGVIQCFRIIRGICGVWAAMAVAAATGYGASLFAAYTRQARKSIRGYWETAHLLVSWSEKIRKAAPYLVLGDVASLSKKRSITGLLFPMNPLGPHDGKNTLELHVTPGPPITLLDAIAPIQGAVNRIRKHRVLKTAAKSVISAIDAALRGIVGTSRGPIRMLEPEKDFSERQYVRFAGSIDVPAIPLPFLDDKGKRRIHAEALAQPYGGGTAEMTWKSRLFERSSR